jgi:PAS domain S-box-containing protein
MTPSSHDTAFHVDRENERRFQALIENIADAITLVDSDGIIQYASSAVARILGYTIDEFVGRDAFGFIHSDDLAYAKSIFSKALEQPGIGVSVEIRMQHKDSSWRWVEGVINNSLHEPSVKAIVVNFRDVARRKQAETALRETEERWWVIFENSAVGIAVTDLDGRFVVTNQAYQDMVGYTDDELREMTFLTITHEDDRAAKWALVTEVIEGSRSEFAIEKRYRRKDGDLIWVHNAVSLMRDRAQRPRFIIVMVEDITRRKQSEAALAESQRRLQALFDNTLDAILLTDDRARYIGANPSACALTGYRHEELLQLTVWDVTPGPNREPGLELWRAFIAAGQQSGEYTVLRKDGTTVEVEYRAVANIVPGLHLSVLRDITERKQADKELERLFERLRDAHQRMRSLSRQLVEAQEVERRQLARELHDQVGQNLAALNINLSILHSHLSAQPEMTIISRLDDSLRLVGETVERIRDVMAELRPAVLDDYGLLAALRWYAERFSERSGIVTQVHGTDRMLHLPAAVETALFRIAQEALTNVTKHSQAKQATVTLEALNGAARLIIADDGIGFIPTEPRESGGPRGVGLDIMRERVEAVGGHFVLASVPGQGTQVIVEVAG